MNDKILYFDEADGIQKERYCTDEEQDEINARKNAPPPIEYFNAPILASLEDIDKKSIRALREGNDVRIAELEQQAAVLRLKIKK